jgi:hypothetical protein
MTNLSCNVCPPFALDDPETSPKYRHKGGRKPASEDHISTDDFDGPPNSRKNFERQEHAGLIRPGTGCPGHLEASLQFTPKADVFEASRRSEAHKTHAAALNYRKEHRKQQQKEHDQKVEALDAKQGQQLVSRRRAAAAHEALSKQHGFNIISLQDKSPTAYAN